jgi:hypothetical protein
MDNDCVYLMCDVYFDGGCKIGGGVGGGGLFIAEGIMLSLSLCYNVHL